MVADRWIWITACRSTSGVSAASASLIASSSRGGASARTGVVNQVRTSTRPARVMAKTRCESSGGSPPSSAVAAAIRPSRSSRANVV